MAHLTRSPATLSAKQSPSFGAMRTLQARQAPTRRARAASRLVTYSLVPQIVTAVIIGFPQEWKLSMALLHLRYRAAD